MKNKNSKKMLYAAVLFLLLAVQGMYAESYEKWTKQTLETNGFDCVSQTRSLELYVNKKTALFAVRRLDSGYVWYSSPVNWEEDAESSGFNKNALPSLLSITMKDNQGALYPANSYVNAVKRGGFQVEKIDGGVKLTNTFKREGVEVPLYVTIEDDTLLLRVNFNEIWEDEEDVMRIIDFQVAPYFGAAPDGENGYLFVPDGSGAVINFNNRKTESPYQQYVYGRDKSVIPTKVKNVTEDAALPVFGMKRAGGGFIAVIEHNEANASINAESAGQKTGFNAAYASCIVRDFDTFTFRERTGTPRDIRIFQTRKLADSDEYFSVRYIFLDKDCDSYTDMAKAYRLYLQKNNAFPLNKTEKKSSLMLNFIGAGMKKKPVAGIPANVNYPYTPFADVRSVIETLKKKGVNNFTVKYDGWITGGILGRYPSSPSPEGNLGGNRGMNNLIAYLNDNGIPFYAGADFVNLYSPDATHIKELNTNRAINRSPVKIPDYRLSTFDENTSRDSYPYWILRASAVKKWYNSFLSKFNSSYAGVGFAPDSLGNTAGSDFARKNGTTRTGTIEVFKSLLEEAQTSGHPIMLSRPYSYAFGSVSYVADVPALSSRFEVESYSVPFYQIVLHGYVPFANLPSNRTPDPQAYVLGLLESGSDPSYLWITRHPEGMRDSNLQWYTNVYAADWIEEAADLYKKIKPVLDSIAGCEIISHTVLPSEARITTYENGVKILTNYSDHEVTAEGLTAAPYSYASGR
jgi:hypothetical protein